MGRMTRTAGPAAPLLKTIISDFGDLRLRVGFFETARYADGTPVAYVAAIHEFGAPAQGIPPRPFMRPAAEQNQEAWNGHLAAGARAVARGAIRPDQVLEQIGALAAGNVSEAIAAVTSPPLKEETVEAKARKYADGGARGPGSLGKPLVDTGLLIQSPTYVVDRGDATLSVPGRNNLALAMSVLQPQTAALARYVGRTTNAAGQQTAAYAAPVAVTGGSIQPVPANRYEQLGLDRTKRYVQWWALTSIFGTARLRAPDRFTWNGADYEVTQEDDWHVQDGWTRVIAVRLDGRARVMAAWLDIVATLRAALLPRLPGLADVVQGYQPETQGSPDGPHLILHEVSSVDYGWPRRAEVWRPDLLRYDHVETQQRETTIQINASVPGLAVGEPVPADWLALTRAHLRSDPVLAELRAVGLSILRPRDIRALPVQLDNDRWQVSASFDVVVRHSDILTLSTPAATSVELIIQRV